MVLYNYDTIRPCRLYTEVCKSINIKTNFRLAFHTDIISWSDYSRKLIASIYIVVSQYDEIILSNALEMVNIY